MFAEIAFLIETVRRRPIVSASLMGMLTIYMVMCIRSGNDFVTFYDLSRMSLARSGHIYDRTPTTGMTVGYLPQFALLTIPLSLVPFQLAAGLWFWSKCGVAVRLVELFSRWSSRFTPRERMLHAALPLLAAANFINNDFRLGQVNLVVHAFIVFSFVALLKGRHQVASLLYVLSSFKIVPLLLLPYFILRRQWRFLIGVVGWSAVLCALLVAWFGWDEVASLPLQVSEQSYGSKLDPSSLANVDNQSLVGAAVRIGAFNNDVGQPTDITAYMATGLVASLVLLAAVYGWIALRHREQPQMAEFGVLILAILLAFPETKTAHLVNLLLPLYLLVSATRWNRFRLREHWWFLITFVVFFGSGRDLIGSLAFNYSFYFSSHTAVMMLLLALMVKRSTEIGRHIPNGRLPDTPTG